MLKSLFSVFFAISLLISVAVSPICASIGDTEEKALESHGDATLVSSRPYDSHAKILTFRTDDAIYYTLVMDGKVVGEGWDMAYGNKAAETAAKEMVAYDMVWSEVESPLAGSKGFVSTGNKYSALWVRREWTVTFCITSKDWNEYVAKKKSML